jgi:hypothetical protein
MLGALAAGTALCGGAQPPAPEPNAAQLAALVFPGWSDTHGGRLRTVTLPADAHAARNGWHAGSARVLVEPALVLRTDASHLTLIAQLVPAGDDGKPAVSHMTPVGVAAYQFARAGDRWQVAGRQGMFAWRGFFGEARLQAVMLGAAAARPRQAVGIEYGSCWEGYCGSWIALYELDNNVVRREPALETALSGNNLDGAADCVRRLQPMIKARQQDASVHDDGSAPDTHDCYLVDSTWRIDGGRDLPGDFTIRYQGAISRADGHAAPPAAIDQRQVLRYEHGKYRAVSGFNPVPPI